MEPAPGGVRGPPATPMSGGLWHPPPQAPPGLFPSQRAITLPPPSTPPSPGLQRALAQASANLQLLKQLQQLGMAPPLPLSSAQPIGAVLVPIYLPAGYSPPPSPAYGRQPTLMPMLGSPRSAYGAVHLPGSMVGTPVIGHGGFSSGGGGASPQYYTGGGRGQHPFLAPSGLSMLGGYLGSGATSAAAGMPVGAFAASQLSGPTSPMGGAGEGSRGGEAAPGSVTLLSTASDGSNVTAAHMHVRTAALQGMSSNAGGGGAVSQPPTPAPAAAAATPVPATADAADGLALSSPPRVKRRVTFAPEVTAAAQFMQATVVAPVPSPSPLLPAADSSATLTWEGPVTMHRALVPAAVAAKATPEPQPPAGLPVLPTVIAPPAPASATPMRVSLRPSSRPVGSSPGMPLVAQSKAAPKPLRTSVLSSPASSSSSPRSYRRNAKTMLCRDWAAGHCSRPSEKCLFAHGEAELRNTMYKKQLCTEYTLSGTCGMGAVCSFAHGVEDLRVLSRWSATSGGEGMSRK